MNRVFRLALSLILGVLVFFAVFGFLATFEPLDPAIQVTWRAVYTVLFVACIAGLFMMNLPGKKNRDDNK